MPLGHIPFIRSRTNIDDEDRRSRPQGRVVEVDLPAPLAQHLAERHTHTVETTDSEAPVQDEQRKTWTGTPAARQRAPSQLGATPTMGITKSRENWAINELKGQGCPLLYRLPGEPTCQPGNVGLVPHAWCGMAGCVGPLVAPLAHLGRPPNPPPNSPREFSPLGPSFAQKTHLGKSG